MLNFLTLKDKREMSLSFTLTWGFLIPTTLSLICLKLISFGSTLATDESYGYWFMLIALSLLLGCWAVVLAMVPGVNSLQTKGYRLFGILLFLGLVGFQILILALGVYRYIS